MKLLNSAYLILAFISLNTWAKSSSEALRLYPIVGFERVQKFVPTPSMKTRFVYGAGANYTLGIGQAEAEYTHAADDSTDLSTTPNIFYKDEEDKLKVGMRFSASADFISVYLRGGAQGRQNKQTKTVSGVSSSSTTVSKIQPYVGTGIDINLMNYFSLNADVTAVYAPTSDSRLSSFEISPTLGFSLHF